MNSIFEKIKSEMDIAKKEENFAHFRSAAQKLGLIEKDISAVVNIRYQYTLTLPSGEIISGTLCSYDQSGPFQNLPDMNKIEMQLTFNNQILDKHYVEWED